MESNHGLHEPDGGPNILAMSGKDIKGFREHSFPLGRNGIPIDRCCRRASLQFHCGITVTPNLLKQRRQRRACAASTYFFRQQGKRQFDCQTRDHVLFVGGPATPLYSRFATISA
jgi:hypothetical protein